MPISEKPQNPSRSTTPSNDHPIFEANPIASNEHPDLFAMLQKLLQTFQVSENGLYRMLRVTPISSLNDVRRRFRSEAMRAKRQMSAWQDKNLIKSKQSEGIKSFDSNLVDPEWWAAGSHLLPKSKYIIREKDLGSIIACTLR